MKDKCLTVRAKAFSGEGVRTHRVLVEADTILPVTRQRVHGRVRVWDSVAGYYTTCHSLCEKAERRIRRLAEQWA